MVTGGSATRIPESRPPVLTVRTVLTGSQHTNCGRNMSRQESRIRIIQDLSGISPGPALLIFTGSLPGTMAQTALFLTLRTEIGGSVTRTPESRPEAIRETKVTRAMPARTVLTVRAHTRCGRGMSRRQSNPAVRSLTRTAMRSLLMTYQF